MVHSEGFDVNNKSELFLQIMMGLLFASNEDIGYDPTMYLDEQNVWHIRMKEKDYKFVKQVWSSDMIQGHGTWCWIVECDGKRFVMKDSWILASRSPTEVEFFEHTNKLEIKHLARMVYYENVEVREGVLDTTDSHRCAYKKLENCIHCQIFFAEEGTPIYMFQSKRDLVCALIEIIEYECRLVTAYFSLISV